MWIQCNNQGYVCYCGETQQPNSVEYTGEFPQDWHTNFIWYKLIDGQLILDTESKSAAERLADIQEEVMALKEALAQSDYNCNKVLEGLFSVMTNSTALNLVPNLLSYIASIKDDYTQIFKDRQAARDRINELEN